MKEEKSKRTQSKSSAFNKALGNHLRSLREAKKMSTYDLDEKSQVHYNLIAKIERGEISPTAATLFSLSKGLNVPASKLLQFDFKE